MHVQQRPHSGSRWEPSPAPSPEAGGQDRPPQTPPLRPLSTAGAGQAGRRRRQALFAVAAIGLLLAGGAGGFAIGHATAGTGGAGTGIERHLRDRHPDFHADGGRFRAGTRGTTTGQLA